MATAEKPAKPQSLDLPWLENGERLDQKTFHERYERMPSGTKAELVEGIVYVMPSPLSRRHARGDFRLAGCLFNYSAATPGTEGQNNATTILGEDSEPQPDSALLILEEFGGQSREGPDEYTHGAPELIVETALSSRSIDLHAKLRDYEKAGAREYVVFEARSRLLHGFERIEGKLTPLAPGDDGIFRSRVFPGLWIDANALAANDKAGLIATLQRGLAGPDHAAFVAELGRRKTQR